MIIVFWIALCGAALSLILWPIFQRIGGGTLGQWIVLPWAVATSIAAFASVAFVVIFALHSLGVDISIHHGGP